MNRLAQIFLTMMLLVSTNVLAGNIMGSFETEDLQGTTSHFNGTVGTTAIKIPSTATTIIAELIFRCPAGQAGVKVCSISFDGGTNFFDISEGEFIAWSLKGNLKQVDIKGNAAGTIYQMIVNREAW